MSRVTKLPTAAQIDEEAAAWVWRMDAGSPSSELRSEFEGWLRRDARHRAAFAELGGVWSELDGLAEAKREEKIATFVADQRRIFGGALPDARGGRWRRLGLPALAATLLLALGVWVWSQRGHEAQALATAVGQQRAVTLADGSTVHLNTNTILETQLDREQRVVHLVKGEALFNVAGDRNRPFVVKAGQARVRAIGTEFNVRLREADDIEVLVSEGRVEVQSGAENPGSPLTLDAGQRWGTSAARPAVAMEGPAMAKTLAWRDGAIVFDGDRLSQAIAELNRYTDTRFIIDDRTVREMKVGGRFKAGDVDEFLAALQRALPVTVRRTPDNVIYIERHP